MPSSTRQWVLNTQPTTLPSLTGPSPTFTLTTNSLPTITPTQALIKPTLFSNDPAQRLWIPPLAKGEPLASMALAEVIESGSPSDLPVGSIVFGRTTWSEYAVHEIAELRVVKPLEGLSLGHYHGALGWSGLTAYYGLIDKAKAGKEDTVVISGAAGAVGSIAVQIARGILGAKRVIGIAGSDEKCRWVEKLGADVCINYKKDGFEQDLVRETEGGVDVFFDNVGGSLMELMIPRMKTFGRIALCGAIGDYNRAEPHGIRNIFRIVPEGVTIYGFSVLHYLDKTDEVMDFLVQAWKDGKIVLDDSLETLVEAKFEEVPAIWMRLFEGRNTGKLVTRIFEY
ncbi:hypothetical protein BJY04DRAFT_231665 [Aspergillus karnatakaensis]|uniref:MDR family NADP-dependent oxidoreductase n=1 Tax=Aspergillus karnatakaensis TaxID=1810916 RepID=UPI003CCCB07C